MVFYFLRLRSQKNRAATTPIPLAARMVVQSWMLEESPVFAFFVELVVFFRLSLTVTLEAGILNS